MKRLCIIGATPESSFVGGVTIHVQRLLQGLKARGVRFEFADYKKIGVPRACLFILHRRGCVHIHVTNPYLLLIFVVCCKLSLSRCLFTLHANHGRFAGFKNLCLSVAMRMADVPILINKHSYEVYRNYNKQAMYIPAFIPPIDERPLSTEIKTILASCKSKGLPIVSTNASKTAVDKYGNDIYGMDFLISYFSDHQDYVLLISDPKGGYKTKHSPVPDNVVFIDQPHSYYELLKNVDIFVRNTSTDGDALSVKEALYLGLPTLCSDVVDRPKGSILFKYGDESSFSQALADGIKPDALDRNKREQCDVIEALINLYNN